MALEPGLKVPGLNTGLRPALNGLWASVAAGLAAITSGSDLATVMGYNAPDALWKGDEASGATDLVGSADLVDRNTPTHNSADPVFGVDGVTMSDSTTDSLDAATTSVLDLGDVSVAALYVGSTLVGTAFNNWLAGKATSSAGWNFNMAFSPSGALRWFTRRSGSGAKLETIAQDHTAGSGIVVLLGVNDKNADNVQFWSGLGASAGQVSAPAGSMTNAVKLGIGAGNSLATGVNFCMAALWHGANAEGLTSTHRQALADYLGVS